ncbi:MAG: hypothetical protein EOO02_06305 [Chitinophagaceae bacterium]|nr:MAG: hypothetical protein EOO02_06305 [Chitinophagaceae bacterium]
MLAKRKDIEFDAYNNYIIEISGEIDAVRDQHNISPDLIRVTHFNPGKYIGLGTLKKPAFLTVQDEDLAIQILTAAADRKWLVLIEDKDSVPPDTFELDLLQSGLIPGPEFEDAPKKNEPCTCGSGKPYKKCCGRN